MKARIVPLLVAPLLSLAACQSKPSPSGLSESANAAAPGETATPSATAEPSSAAPSASASARPTPYQGPTGTLTGRIRIQGDPPPEVHHRYPRECGGEAAATYGKLFRVGQDSALADAIVAVTHYDGFVPPKKAAIDLTVRNCAFSTRAVAITDGQHLSIKNVDSGSTSYLPRLDGARQPATIVAVPHGDPVNLYSRGYGRYWLRDDLARAFMVAHVFHFRYATTDVTGMDGRYRIEGIPVGEVRVNAMLPMAVEGKDPKTGELDPTPLSVSKPFVIKEGDNELDLVLTFDAARNVPEKPE